MTLRLKLIPEVDSCVVESSRKEQKDQRLQSVLRYLQLDGPLTWDEWSIIAESRGIPKPTFQRYFVILRENHEIIKKNEKWQAV
jgi:hypothetical protein